MWERMGVCVSERCCCLLGRHQLRLGVGPARPSEGVEHDVLAAPVDPFPLLERARPYLVPVDRAPEVRELPLDARLHPVREVLARGGGRGGEVGVGSG